MRRLSLLCVLCLVACSGLSTPPPPSVTPDSAAPTYAAPTAVPATSASTQDAPTGAVPAPNAATFPDPNAFTWQLIASDLERPVDLQADGSGRLFIIEKLGHIHIHENGQLQID